MYWHVQLREANRAWREGQVAAQINRGAGPGQKTDEIEKRNGARSCWMLNRAGVSSAFFSSLNTLDVGTSTGTEEVSYRKMSEINQSREETNFNKQSSVEAALKCGSEEFRLKCKPSKLSTALTVTRLHKYTLCHVICTHDRKSFELSTLIEKHSLLRWRHLETPGNLPFLCGKKVT